MIGQNDWSPPLEIAKCQESLKSGRRFKSTVIVAAHSLPGLCQSLALSTENNNFKNILFYIFCSNIVLLTLCLILPGTAALLGRSTISRTFLLNKENGLCVRWRGSTAHNKELSEAQSLSPQIFTKLSLWTSELKWCGLGEQGWSFFKTLCNGVSPFCFHKFFAFLKFNFFYSPLCAFRMAVDAQVDALC